MSSENPSRIPIDLDLLKRLGDPNSSEARKAARFNETAGPQGHLDVMKAVKEDHIDGIIGMINSGSGEEDETSELLKRLARHTFYFLAERDGENISAVTSENNDLDLMIYLFTRESHMNDFLQSVPGCEFLFPLMGQITDIFEKVLPDSKFAICLNFGHKAFQIEIPPDMVDMLFNMVTYGPEEIVKFIDKNGRIPQGRM